MLEVLEVRLTKSEHEIESVRRIQEKSFSLMLEFVIYLYVFRGNTSTNKDMSTKRLKTAAITTSTARDLRIASIYRLERL